MELDFNKFLNVMAVPYASPEEIAIGRSIFHNFVLEELQHEHINDDGILEEAEEAVDEDNPDFANENFAANLVFNHVNIDNGVNFNPNHTLQEVGQSIRKISDAFKRSPQRREIEQQALSINLNDLTMENFWLMLDEVFRQGISIENLIALFFFCSDVLKRCIKAKVKELGITLFKACVNYVIQKVARWAHDHGGWKHVLHLVKENTYFTAAAVAVLIVAIGFVFVKQ